MKINQLSSTFTDTFLEKPVIINTKLQIPTPEGIGIMSYRGIMVDIDDFNVYIGFSMKEVTTSIKWDDIATVELWDMNEDAKNALEGKEPESDARN